MDKLRGELQILIVSYSLYSIGATIEILSALMVSLGKCFTFEIPAIKSKAETLSFSKLDFFAMDTFLTLPLDKTSKRIKTSPV